MTMDFTDVDTVDKRRQKKAYSLDIAEVVSVPSDGGHVVSVRRLGDEGGVIGAPALVPSKGDVGLPEPGDIVVIGFAIGGQRIVIGTLYEDDAPSYRRGSRRIGHARTDSNMTIRRDGVIDFTAPFIRLPRVGQDPEFDDIENGAMWYNDAEGEYRGKQNGTIVKFSTSTVEQT